MEDIVLLEYLFMFKPGETWNHLHEFENSFNKYLQSIGFQATWVNPVKGGTSKRLVIIARSDNFVPEDKPSEIKAKTVGKAFTEMKDKIKDVVKPKIQPKKKGTKKLGKKKKGGKK